MYKGCVCMANLDMCVYLGDLEVEETAQQRGVLEVPQASVQHSHCL